YAIALAMRLISACSIRSSSQEPVASPTVSSTSLVAGWALRRGDGRQRVAQTDQQALLHGFDESRERLLLRGRIGEEIADQTIRFLDGPEGIALVRDVQGHDADADRSTEARGAV